SRVRRAVLDRVVYDVGDRLPQHQTINVDLHTIRDLDTESLVSLLGEDRHRRQHILRELAQIDPLERKAHGSGVPMRQPQKGVDKFREESNFLQHASHILPIVYRAVSPSAYY